MNTLLAFMATINRTPPLWRIFATTGTTSLSASFTTPSNPPGYLITSEGIRYDYTVGAFTVGFEATGSSKWVDVYPTATVQQISFIQVLQALVSAGSTEAGTCDLRAFPNLGGANFSGSGLWKFLGKVTGQLLVRNSNLSGKTLDLSGARFNHVRGAGTLASDLLLPTGTDLAMIQNLELSEMRLKDKSINLAGYTGLQVLSLSSGTAGVHSLDVVSIPDSPNLVTLDVSRASVRKLLYGTTGSPTTLKTLLGTACRLTGRDYAKGDFASLLSLLTFAVGLTTIRLDNNGFTEAELNQLVTAIWSNRESRPTTGTRVLALDDQQFSYYYPTGIINNLFGANAPVTSLATQAKLKDLQDSGWTVTYNKNIIMTATGLTSNRIRVTYAGTADIDLWRSDNDSAVLVSSTTPSLVPNGTYLVVNGSGKVWDLQRTSGSVELAVGQSLLVQVTPPAVP